MARKTVVQQVIDSTVGIGATAVTNTPVIPDGKTLKLQKFGGVCPASALVAIQVGSGGSFSTIRAFGPGSYDWTLDREIKGDGVKFIRIVRINNALLAQQIVAWADAVVL